MPVTNSHPYHQHAEEATGKHLKFNDVIFVMVVSRIVSVFALHFSVHVDIVEHYIFIEIYYGCVW